MGVVHNYMFCAFTVIIGLTFAQEIDSDTIREINLLKWRMDNVNMELLDVKADLKVEKTKTMKLEKQLNTLMEGSKMTKINDTDSDLPGHVSVKDQQQAMDKVSSFIEQRVYQALNDEKMLRKQFQNQTQTDFKTEKENMENKFTVLNETLSAVIETKLQTIANKVRDSVIIINESISSIDNISRHVQQNGGDIISLRVESDQLNTTLMEQSALLSSLNDSIVVVQASVIELQNDSHQYKEDNSRSVQQNNEAINNMLAQSEYGKITLLRHDEALTSLNDTLVDIHASVVELRNDSRHYKEDNSRTLQQNNEAIHNLLALSQYGKISLLRHDAALTSLNDTIVDIHASVVELRNDSRHYKENNSRTVQQNTEAINHLVSQSQHGNLTLLRHDAALTSLNDTLVDINASVAELRDDSRHYKENNSRTVKHNNEAINSLLTQSQHGNTTLLRHDAVMLSLEDSLVNLHAFVMELHKEHTNYMDCYDIHQKTVYPTGLYYVKPHGLNEIVRVLCDMETDGGGWTVFQYRHDGSVDFYQNFTDYENGFGSVTSEFWLGLSYIQVMTSAAPTQLRIDVEAADGTKGFQLYDNFHLTKGPDYALNVGTSSGTIGDFSSVSGLSFNNGYSFSTHDHDRDGSSETNCAEERHGGWWYYRCTRVNLNGQYATPGTRSTIDSGAGGMVYYNFKDKESLKSSKIMFRRK